MPNRKDPHWRAKRLADVLQLHADANPIPFGPVKSITTTAAPEGEIAVIVEYDDDTTTKTIFEPGTVMADMIHSARVTIDRACTDIRRHRARLAEALKPDERTIVAQALLAKRDAVDLEEVVAHWDEYGPERNRAMYDAGDFIAMYDALIAARQK